MIVAHPRIALILVVMLLSGAAFTYAMLAPSSVGAQTPSAVFQVGKTYSVAGLTTTEWDITVNQISGSWLKVREGYWLNAALIARVREK